MRLDELAENTVVNICAIREGETAKLETVVIEIPREIKTLLEQNLKGADYCITERIRKQDARITFDVDNITYKCRAVYDSRAYLWKKIFILTYKMYGNQEFNVIATRDPGLAFEQRSSHRLWMGESGSMSLENHTKPTGVMIKDISLDGIGILCPHEESPEVGDIIRIQFHVKTSYDGKEMFDTLYTLEAEVVRVTKDDEISDVVGCRLTKYDEKKYRYLIMDTQRKRQRTSKR